MCVQEKFVCVCFLVFLLPVCAVSNNYFSKEAFIDSLINFRSMCILFVRLGDVPEPRALVNIESKTSSLK